MVKANNRKRERHHPIYAARVSKEHPLLEELIANDADTAAYLADLKRELDSLPEPLSPVAAPAAIVVCAKQKGQRT